MQLRQLEHFEAVYRLRNYTHAASEQHLTQSALTRSIQALETSLGQRLFDRSTHGVEPTPTAEALIPHAIDTLASARALRDAVGALKGEITGSIAIGTGPYPAHPLMSRVIRMLSASHPDLQVALVGGAASDLLAGLVGRQLDFVVCDTSKLEESPFAEQMRAIELPHEPLVFVAGAENPIVATEPTLPELAACPWALPPVAPKGRRYLPRTFVGIQRSRFPFYEMETTTACLEATRDQRTITLVPLSVAMIECPHRGLRYRLAGPQQRTNDGIHVLRARTPSVAATTAIAMVEQEAARIAEAGRRWRSKAPTAGWSSVWSRSS